MVQWLRLHTPSAKGPCSNPGRGTRFYTPQPRVCMPPLKILGAATKIKDPRAATRTWHSQTNKYFLKYLKIFDLSYGKSGAVVS